MKIVLIGPADPFKGGISHYTTLLFQKLDVSHEVRFYAFSRRYPRWLVPNRFERESDILFGLNGKARRVLDFMNPRTWLSTAQEVVSFSPDILIFPWWVPFWAPMFLTMIKSIKRSCATKVVFICHDVIPHHRHFLERPVTQTVLGLADELIVHCEMDKETILSLLPRAKIHKVFHPTYDVFHREISREEARGKLGIHGFNLLFFGFIRPYKGLRYLLEAMPRIVQETGANLVVAGEFWESIKKYRAMAQRLAICPHVRFIDNYIPSESVHEYFAAADLVMLPYVHCTSSGIVQVAFGCRRPVVATAVGSLPEVIEHGKTGFLVPPKNSEAIARAVIQFHHNGLADHFYQGIVSQSTRFSWDHLIARVESFALSPTPMPQTPVRRRMHCPTVSYSS